MPQGDVSVVEAITALRTSIETQAEALVDILAVLNEILEATKKNKP